MLVPRCLSNLYSSTISRFSLIPLTFFNIDDIEIVCHRDRTKVRWITNVDDLSIFKQAVKDNDNVKCLCVGTGEMESEIRKCIEAEGLQDRIIMIGVSNFKFA